MDKELEILGRQLTAQALREVPAEKLRSVLHQAAIARTMEQAGSIRSDGLGQKMGSVDARTYMRWQKQYPGCWQNNAFVREFFRDNPATRAPGTAVAKGVKATETKIYM